MDRDLDLTGKLLVAMPGMGDPRFERSVIFLCVHSPEGAMGLIVNKPAREISFPQLLDQLGVERRPGGRDIRVHVGGPVEHGRGFVLHSGDYPGSEATLQVDERFAMTATMDILTALAQGHGPRQSLMALGYAGWGPGQLESEILQNGWLTAEASPDLVFSEADGAKWEEALRSLGVDPSGLSSTAGRA
ncbi:YqgE/AlgH family protein [Frigidibacter sp. MR17.14]|uniref:YqgE/AlgH family protein n=1 Tax=Frigidibacter sp. MR17.14 TaxID=3126509 RepID=UPI003012B9ED